MSGLRPRILILRTAPGPVFEAAVNHVRGYDPGASIHVLCRETHREQSGATPGVDVVHTFSGEALSATGFREQVGADFPAAEYWLTVVTFPDDIGRTHANVITAATTHIPSPVVGFGEARCFVALTRPPTGPASREPTEGIARALSLLLGALLFRGVAALARLLAGRRGVRPFPKRSFFFMVPRK